MLRWIGRLFAIYLAISVASAGFGFEPASAAPVTAIAQGASEGFWTVDHAGVVEAHNGVSHFGDLRGSRLNAPVVGIASTPNHGGYWLVASDGGIFSFGNARFHGSTGALRLNKPVVAMTSTPSGAGYWLVASDGGIFSFGDARFFGSTGNISLNQPIVGMTASATGGYWLVASDGGIFSFGNARFMGSTGAIKLNQPIVGMASTPTANGYWLVAADGGIFSFGDAPFLGASLGGARVYGMTVGIDGGYVVLRTDGSVDRKRTNSPTGPINPAPYVPPVSIPSVPEQPSSSNPFANRGFWVDPTNPALAQANAWQHTRPSDASYMAKMGSTSAAVWLGEWTPNISGYVSGVVNSAKVTNSMPVFVAYNIPGRDCGQWSAGGAGNAAHYEAWIDQLASGLRNGPSAVILEPDALAQLDCLDGTSRANRLALLRSAVTKLSAAGSTVYLDAGHAGWHSADEMAQRLRDAGVGNARGFALNVSNYGTTVDNSNYGNALSTRLDNKTYVIDTSRNGNGSNGEWCNPMGRALGASPTANTGNARLDALLWLKRPGESDGNCNGGPSAGVWWPDYALGLARSAWG